MIQGTSGCYSQTLILSSNPVDENQDDLSSGYSLNGEAKRMIERGVHAFIQKPFTMAGISQKVREILDDELNEWMA